MSISHKKSLFSITIEELSGIRRDREPVRFGVPFPKGMLRQCDQIEVRDQTGKLQPSQATLLAHWPDGSIQWALAELFAQVESGGRAQYNLNIAGAGTVSKDGLVIEEDDRSFRVSTGRATFEVPKNIFKPLGRVIAGGKDLLSEEGMSFRLIDTKGGIWTPVPTRLQWVIKGALRSSLRIDGSFSSDTGKPIALFTAYLDFWSGSSFCSVKLQVHNPRAALHPGGTWDLGDPGSVYFSDLSLIVPLKNDLCGIEVHTDADTDPLKLDDRAVVLYQDSSGSDHWDSPNHVNCRDELTVSFQGYRLWAGDQDEMRLLKEGKRANPNFIVDTGEGWVSGGVEDFWQNFPKALSVKANAFRISLFPQESSGPFELQGGEKKTHKVFLDFGNHLDHNAVPQLLSPLRVSIDPTWIEKTGVIPYFVPEAEDPNDTYIKYINNVIEGPHSFFKKREIIDEYGWRNFGDIYADHEAVHHKRIKPFISHYNNQYDVVYGAGVHYLRSGNQQWYDLMSQYARHIIDIDIYHTDQDKPAYNHGFFWHTDHYREACRSTHRTYSKGGAQKGDLGAYGGGPGNEHNYTSGLLLYYYLTGDISAKDSIIELAQWVLDMDDGAKGIWCLFDEGPVGLASQTFTTDYHGPGRGSGNSINCLIDSYKLTGHRHYLLKAEELIQRSIHPDDEVAKHNLDNPEARWSYLVFLQVLGKYLDLKSELKEHDWSFFYARDSLLHYAAWLIENEVPYKEVLDKVDIPTETWPAQDIRKAHVLNHALKYSPSEIREIFRERARFFFDRCLEDLLTFETAYLTRPMVILMVYGYIQACFDLNRSRPIDYLEHDHQFGTPTEFVPQPMRIKYSLKNKLRSVSIILEHMIRSKYHALKASLLSRQERERESS